MISSAPRRETLSFATWVARAQESLRVGDAGQAIAALRQALAFQPSHAPLQHDLGFLCLEAGHPQEAAAAFEAALAADPDFSLAAMRLGVARQALDQPGAAMAAYERAMAGQPFLVEAGYRAGAVLESLGRRAEAILVFRRAAAAATTSNLGRLSAARAFIAEENDPAAEAILQDLLAAEPGHAAANDLLAHVLADSGRFDEARDHFERAIAAAPLLQVVGRLGLRFDAVEVPALTARGIPLMTAGTAMPAVGLK